MSDKPIILLAELQPWEEQQLRERCSCHCDVQARDKPLQRIGDDDLPSDAVILSPFIRSECSAEQLQRLPNLRAITTRSTGYDHIDMDYCRDHGIVVCNVPTYGDNTVAEHTFALILALTRKIHRCYERVLRGDFSLEGLRGIDLEGKTFGCIGTGSIGRHALRIARGFAMRRLAFDVKPDARAAAELEFQYVDFDTLIAESHVVSLHVPLNEKTHHMINADVLKRMRQGAILINTARGGLIDPQALIDSLRAGHLGGAGLDVLAAEQAVAEEAELLTGSFDIDALRATVQNHALIRMENVIITPHVAFNSVEAVSRILDTTVENLHGILDGEPHNVVGDTWRGQQMQTA